MLIHERQAQARKLRDAITVTDEHSETVSTISGLSNEFDFLLSGMESAKHEGSPHLREQAASLLADLSAFRVRFAELTATAKHDLRNAEQIVVINRSKVAA